MLYDISDFLLSCLFKNVESANQRLEINAKNLTHEQNNAIPIIQLYQNVSKL